MQEQILHDNECKMCSQYSLPKWAICCPTLPSFISYLHNFRDNWSCLSIYCQDAIEIFNVIKDGPNSCLWCRCTSSVHCFKRLIVKNSTSQSDQKKFAMYFVLFYIIYIYIIRILVVKCLMGSIPISSCWNKTSR